MKSFFAALAITPLIACAPTPTTLAEDEPTPEEQLWDETVASHRTKRANIVNKNRCEKYWACEAHVSELHGRQGTPENERGDHGPDGDCWENAERSEACGDQCQDTQEALVEFLEDEGMDLGACAD